MSGFLFGTDHMIRAKGGENGRKSPEEGTRDNLTKNVLIGVHSFYELYHLGVREEMQQNKLLEQ